MRLLVPMSGEGQRFRAAGYGEPKPLVPVCGEPMITRLMRAYPDRWPKHFVISSAHEGTALPGFLAKHWPRADVTVVPAHKKGPSHAALAALDSIPPDEPVLLSYCDFGMSWDADRFERFVSTTGCDACLVSYRGFHAHYLSPVPYAYSRMEGDRVLEVREKGCFTQDRETEFASCGAYYFKSAAILREAIEAQIAQGISLNGEFYTSLTVEALLRSRPEADVRVFEIPFFLQWGTPEDLETYEYWERAFTAKNQFGHHRAEVAQLLMPMAGAGSRTRRIAPFPKPYLPLLGSPLFREALASLPRAKKASFVALEEHKSFFGAERDGESVRWLTETPPGQAFSTEAGIGSLDPQREVLVSACDHGLVIHPDRWRAFRASAGVDALVFTMKGFPGPRRRPNAYSYVQSDGNGPLPRVRSVSVKQPKSATPWRESLLIGTFWFRDAAFLGSAIQALRARDDRVNGELYLDSVVQLLVDQGADVREFPLEGYFNWGDEDSLAEALYWQEYFCGRAHSRRSRYPGTEAT